MKPGRKLGRAPLPLLLALLLAGPLVGMSTGPADAQFGGMPGMPGAPGAGFPGGGGGGGGGFGAPAGPPPACQQLIAMRDEVQKHGLALGAANKRHAPVAEACKLFKVFLAAESKFLKSMEDGKTICGVPAEVITQAKLGHESASKAGKQVCEMAANGGGPAAPSLSDALGSTPALPDTTSATKSGGSTFDTLTGSPLAR
jgi:hypothetical protein